MTYALPVLIALMMGFMVWSVTFRLRRDRLREERRADRSGVIMSRRQRVRQQLNRAFGVPKEKPDWEAPLVATLASVDEESDEKR